MNSRRSAALFIGLRVCLAPLLFASASPARAADPTVHADPRLGPVFRDAVREAALRLESTPCRFLLGDFVDQRTGRPLEETLAALGLAPSVFLLSIRFRSAEGDLRCRSPSTLSFTTPGRRVVYVCPARMLGIRTRSGGSWVPLLLHETLHSLGLGEDPPSPAEIDEAVETRCGR